MRLIDADALIEKMDDKYSLGEIGRRERDDVVNALEFEPTIQPEPHWIPVTKQMPPINEDVLVSGDGYVWKDALLPRDESNVLEWYHDGTFRDDYAWQPLPEPYKGVTE